MVSKSTRRRAVRLVCKLPARVDGPRGTVRGTCRSISEGGLFFVGAALPIGGTVSLSLELGPRDAIKVDGEVRYHHVYPEGDGMGIRFSRLTQEDLARLTRYLADSGAR